MGAARGCLDRMRDRMEAAQAAYLEAQSYEQQVYSARHVKVMNIDGRKVLPSAAV